MHFTASTLSVESSARNICSLSLIHCSKSSHSLLNPNRWMESSSSACRCCNVTLRVTYNLLYKYSQSSQSHDTIYHSPVQGQATDCMSHWFSSVVVQHSHFHPLPAFSLDALQHTIKWSQWQLAFTVQSITGAHSSTVTTGTYLHAVCKCVKIHVSNFQEVS